MTTYQKTLAVIFGAFAVAMTGIYAWETKRVDDRAQADQKAYHDMLDKWSASEIRVYDKYDLKDE